MQRASVGRVVLNWVFLAVGVAALLISIRFLTHQSKKGAKKKRAGGFSFVVVTAKATRGNIVRSLTVSGDVAPYRSFTLRSEIDAAIKTVKFRAGQVVKKGDLLLTFDRSDLDLAVRHKQALLRKSQAALLKADAQLARDRDDYSRLRRLKVGRTVTESELERARFQVKASEANVSEMKAAIVLQRVELDMAKRNLERAELRAPRNGVVNALFVEEGDQVTRGTKLFEITGTDRIEVHLLVPLRYSDEVP
ncbi:MAG: efflux RND transporter periplasmic adaptor subunit, partial [Myxococcales bacterium]|nr:efflux RND transporter periplasmic adaptor subunit [Myxococcales bacterium]